MNLTFLPDVLDIPLNPRPGYDAMIKAGSPKAFGRVVSLSEDKRTARAGRRGRLRSRPTAGRSTWR